MKKMFLAAAASVIAFSAQADISDKLTLENCYSTGPDHRFRVCNVTNLTNDVIAEIQFSHLYTQEGRTVPWVDTGVEEARWKKVEGGIEPNETVELWIMTPMISHRADLSLVDFLIVPVRATNARGETIE